MFSVIFEVLPGAGKKDDYLDHAKHLKPILETVDGFIDNERFESQRRPGWVLSHSTWRDEKSVVRWRTEGEHHATQGKGRFEIFRDYHLRVGEVTSDTAPPEGVPVVEHRFDETEIGVAKMATFTEIVPTEGVELTADLVGLLARIGFDASAPALVEHDIFASIYNPGKLALLVAWTDAAAAENWLPHKADGVSDLRHRKVRVIRDYGRFDRREAPQYYPDAQGRKTLHAERSKCPFSG
jgi:heme-degrading monooxygenase HmoA